MVPYPYFSFETFCTCDKVCTLSFKVKLFHEENLTEWDEGENCDVVCQADETEQPERAREGRDVTKSNLQYKTSDDEEAGTTTVLTMK